MKIERLTSPHNPLLKAVRRAVQRGEPTADGLCVAEGIHLLQEAIRSRCEVRAVIVCDEQAAGLPNDLKVYAIPPSLFADIASTETPQGVLSLVKIREWTLDDLAPRGALVVVLDGVQEPGNAGAIVRTAEAFGATGVMMLKGTVNGWNPKALRASAGSLFRVPFVQGVEDGAFHAFTEARGLRRFAAMPGGDVPLHQADLRGQCAIIIGNEGRGVRQTIAEATAALSIPTLQVESLNAAVAAGVILYEALRQRSSR